MLPRTARIVILALTTLLLACPQRTSIGDLTRNPGRYSGKEVSVVGTVGSSFGALGSGAFEVHDETGNIWAVSQNFGTPGSGTKVALVGVVTQGVSLGGRSFAVALRLTRPPKY